MIENDNENDIELLRQKASNYDQLKLDFEEYAQK